MKVTVAEFRMEVSADWIRSITIRISY